MENAFQVPAKPWREAEIKALMAHADILPDDVREELGLKAIGNGTTEEIAASAEPVVDPAATPSPATQDETPESTPTEPVAPAAADDASTDAVQTPAVDNQAPQTA